MNENEYLTTSDAAKIAEVVPDTIRLWNRMGVLPAIRTVGGVRLFRREDVNRVVQARRDAAIERARNAADEGQRAVAVAAIGGTQTHVEATAV